MDAPKLRFKISKELLLAEQLAGRDLKKVVAENLAEVLEEGEKDDVPPPGFRLHSDADLVLTIEYEHQHP